MAEDKIFTVEEVAAICHDANRRMCINAGDLSQQPWEDAADWQKESAIKGVQFALDNPEATPADQHEAWSADKLKDGWGYGEVKDEVAKTHPCLVPYHQLPTAQQAKDHLFRGIVFGLIPFVRMGEETADAAAGH